MDAFLALADPTRRQIIESLASGESAFGDLADQFDMSRPAVSQHLKVLREAGLVHVRKDAQRRIYRLNAEGLDELEAWLDSVRRFWGARLDDLDRLLDPRLIGRSEVDRAIVLHFGNHQQMTIGIVVDCAWYNTLSIHLAQVGVSLFHGPEKAEKTAMLHPFDLVDIGPYTLKVKIESGTDIKQQVIEQKDLAESKKKVLADKSVFRQGASPAKRDSGVLQTKTAPTKPRKSTEKDSHQPTADIQKEFNSFIKALKNTL